MPGWINHRQIEAFHVVMLTGSMTEAGKILGITQPAISRLIRELETKIGFALFQRQRRKIKPTPEGVMLHKEVDRSMQGLSRIESAAEGIAELKSDILRVAATLSLSVAYVVKAVKQFREEYPDVEISISTDTSASVIDKLTVSHFDVGMAFFPGEIQGLEIEPLRPVEGVCVLPKGHPLANYDKIRIEDLAGLPLICQIKESQVQYKILSMFRAANVEPMVEFEANLALIMCKLVENGLGVAIAEPITAKEFMGDEVIIKPFRPVVSFETGIAFPTHLPRTKVAQAFADTLKQLYNEDFG